MNNSLSIGSMQKSPWFARIFPYLTKFDPKREMRLN